MCSSDLAEAIVEQILARLSLQGHEQVVDAYCGIGTLSLPLARQAGTVLGIETQREAVQQAERNAKLNGIENARFQAGAVEQMLQNIEGDLDVVLLDPPRKGCDRRVIETLRQRLPQRIVYLSCKPATLARDLKLLCAGQQYRLTHVQPIDFFPQTAHIESAAFLERV